MAIGFTLIPQKVEVVMVNPRETMSLTKLPPPWTEIAIPEGTTWGTVRVVDDPELAAHFKRLLTTYLPGISEPTTKP